MVSAVILAAGSSTRMGRDKLSLKFKGKTLLQHAIDNALASKASEVIVVLGHEAATLRAEIRPAARLRMVENPSYREGMSTSLKAGLRELDPQAEAVLVLLGDQPLVDAKVLDALIDKYQETGASMVAPAYRGEWGNPVLFHKSLFPELMEVEGDVGGREVVARHRDRLELVPIESALASKDVDTWEDYLSLSQTGDDVK